MPRRLCPARRPPAGPLLAAAPLTQGLWRELGVWWLGRYKRVWEVLVPRFGSWRHRPQEAAEGALVSPWEDGSPAPGPCAHVPPVQPGLAAPHGSRAGGVLAGRVEQAKEAPGLGARTPGRGGSWADPVPLAGSRLSSSVTSVTARCLPPETLSGRSPEFPEHAAPPPAPSRRAFLALPPLPQHSLREGPPAGGTALGRVHSAGRCRHRNEQVAHVPGMPRWTKPSPPPARRLPCEGCRRFWGSSPRTGEHMGSPRGSADGPGLGLRPRPWDSSRGRGTSGVKQKWCLRLAPGWDRGRLPRRRSLERGAGSSPGPGAPGSTCRRPMASPLPPAVR